MSIPTTSNVIKSMVTVGPPAAAASIHGAVRSPYSVLYVTTPTKDVATKIASGLLEKRLVACVNIIPGITSMYRWEGKIASDEEQLMVMKTRQSLFNDVAKFVKENHPYDVPEVIELPIEQGHKEYIDWIGESTKDPNANE